MSKSKTFNVFRSTLTGVTNSLLLLLLNLLSRKLFLNYIGIEYLSVAQVITNLLAVFSFTELGLASSVIYMLYNPIANGETEKIKKIVWLYRKFNRFVGFAILFIGIAFMPFLHSFINTSIPVTTIYLIFVLNLVTSVSSYFYTYRSVLLSAYQQDYVISLAQTGVSFLRIIIQCLLIYLTHDYILFLIIGLFATVVQNAIVFYVAGSKYPYIKGLNYSNKTSDIIHTQKELLKNISAMASVKITAIVINNTDNILISWLNTIMVGLCSNYTTISLQLKSLVTIFHTSLLHSVGIASAEKDNRGKYKLFKEILLINTFVVGVISVCLGALWDGFIVIWLGREYILTDLVFYSLLLNFTWGLMIAPVWMFRDANGIFVYIKKMLLVNAALNLVLSVLLGKIIGVAGVFFATVISDLFTDFWYDSRILYKKVFDKSNALPYQAHIVFNVSLVMMLVFALRILFAKFDTTLLNWCVEAIFTCIVYVVIFVGINFGKEEFKGIKRRMLIKLEGMKR